MRVLYFIAMLNLPVAGCGGIKVRQDYDPAVDFSVLRTFNWHAATQPPTGNELADSGLLDSRIRAAIEKALLAKGHRKVVTGPDYRVAYSYTISDRVEPDPYDTRVGVGVGKGSRGTFGGIGINLDFSDRDSEQDTLTIDLIDTAGNNLVWRGLARRRLVWHADPEQNITRINETVTAILDEFPPGNSSHQD
jgi:hypothetical protein